MQVIDLSLPVSEDTAVVAEETGYTDPPVRFDTWVTIEEKGYKVTAIQMGPHAGTHCDVSSHYVIGGRTITDVPAEAFVGFCTVLDFVGKGQISLGDLHAALQREAKPHHSIVVLRTMRGDALTDEARQRLAMRKPSVIIAGQGWDSDLNYRDSDFFHRQDIPIILNADHNALRLVKSDDFVCCAPIKFAGLEASPVRMIAVRGLVGEGMLTPPERSWWRRWLTG
jgi:kynurenine formamidase